jgi:hypothetical protein
MQPVLATPAVVYDAPPVMDSPAPTFPSLVAPAPKVSEPEPAPAFPPPEFVTPVKYQPPTKTDFSDLDSSDVSSSSSSDLSVVMKQEKKKEISPAEHARNLLRAMQPKLGCSLLFKLLKFYKN